MAWACAWPGLVLVLVLCVAGAWPGLVLVLVLCVAGAWPGLVLVLVLCVAGQWYYHQDFGDGGFLSGRGIWEFV